MITCIFEKGSKASLRHVVVHAIVEKNGKILIVRRSKGMFLEGGKLALPGGFLDRDETGEECVLRELKEETGWEGKVISLFRINTNPNRPHEDRQNVAFDFIIKPIKKAGKPDRESQSVHWIPISKLRKLSGLAFDHGESIKLYLQYKKKLFSLPLIN